MARSPGEIQGGVHERIQGRYMETKSLLLQTGVEPDEKRPARWTWLYAHCIYSKPITRRPAASHNRYSSLIEIGLKGATQNKPFKLQKLVGNFERKYHFDF